MHYTDGHANVFYLSGKELLYVNNQSLYIYNQSQFCDVGIMLSRTSAWDFLELVVVVEHIMIAADYLNFITNQVCFFMIFVNFVTVV